MALVDTTIIEPDPINRFQRWGFTGVIAECPDTGAHLVVGSGWRRAGRPRRYFIKIAACHLPAGYFDQTQIGTVTAYYDEDAIVKANDRLRKLQQWTM
jgi:hypothetical protein